MARVKVYMLRRALFTNRTHISEDPDRWTPFCGRKGSFRTVHQTATPLCKVCVDEFERRHPRAGLFTHVAGLEADDAIEERMDELARENGDLRARLDRLEREAPKPAAGLRTGRQGPDVGEGGKALGPGRAVTRRSSQVRGGGRPSKP